MGVGTTGPEMGYYISSAGSPSIRIDVRTMVVQLFSQLIIVFFLLECMELVPILGL